MCAGSTSQRPASPGEGPVATHIFLIFFMPLILEWSDTKVYEPEIRALLEIASHYCETVVLESGTVPFATHLPSLCLLNPEPQTWGKAIAEVNSHQGHRQLTADAQNLRNRPLR